TSSRPSTYTLSLHDALPIFSITINGNEVAVSAEVKHEKVVKNGETVLCAERYYGKIQRAFSFGQEVDEASAQAKYNDGVLELTRSEEHTSELQSRENLVCRL